MKTAIVYGPVGCGKTTHAKLIAQLLGIPETNILDDWDPEKGPFKPGYLHLMHEHPDCFPGKVNHTIFRSFDSFNFPRFDTGLSVIQGLQLGVVTAEIIGERLRQIEAKGYDSAHDDEHHHGEIAAMAGAYALLSVDPNDQEKLQLNFWPWEEPMPAHHARRELLVTAAALLVAEIERLDRHAEKLADCSCMEVLGEDPACTMHGHGTEWAAANPDPTAGTEH